MAMAVYNFDWLYDEIRSLPKKGAYYECPVCDRYKLSASKNNAGWNCYSCGTETDKEKRRELREVLAQRADKLPLYKNKNKHLGKKFFRYYLDENGARIVRVVVYYYTEEEQKTKSGNKNVHQESLKPGGNPKNDFDWVRTVSSELKQKCSLYNFHRVKKFKEVIFTEGEAAADALLGAGIPAIAFMGGARKGGVEANKDQFTELAKRQLQYFDSIILSPDCQRLGLDYMEAVSEIVGKEKCKWLYPHPDSLSWLSPGKADGYDIADWLYENNEIPKEWYFDEPFHNDKSPCFPLEQGVIIGALNAKISPNSLQLEPKHFDDRNCGKIWSQMKKIDSSGRVLTHFSLKTVLAENEIGFEFDSDNDAQFDYSIIQDYEYEIISRWVVRQLKKESDSLANISTFDYDEKLEEYKAKVSKIKAELPDVEDLDKHRLTAVSESLIDSFQVIESGVEKSGENLPLPTGFYDLDKLTSNGFLPASLVTVAGETGKGKTTFVVQNLALNLAKSGSPIAIFSSEMTKHQLSVRLIARESKISGVALNTGYIADDQWESIAEAVGSLSELPLFLSDNPSPSCSYIESQIEQVEKGLGIYFRVVVIDGLKDMLLEKSWGKTQSVEDTVRRIRAYAQRTGKIIILMVQYSRAGFLKDSVEIRQNSHYTIELDPPDFEKNCMPDSFGLPFVITKQREGPSNVTFELTYIPAQYRMENKVNF